jgi:hypothetical protein
MGSHRAELADERSAPKSKPIRRTIGHWRRRARVCGRTKRTGFVRDHAVFQPPPEVTRMMAGRLINDEFLRRRNLSEEKPFFNFLASGSAIVRLVVCQRDGRGWGPANFLNSSISSGSRGSCCRAFSNASGKSGVAGSEVSFSYALT